MTEQERTDYIGKYMDSVYENLNKIDPTYTYTEYLLTIELRAKALLESISAFENYLMKGNNGK